MSDQIATQLITAIVTLIALYFHRRQGSKENKGIAISLNGDRQKLLDEMKALREEVSRLSGVNVKLETEKIMHESPK